MKLSFWIEFRGARRITLYSFILVMLVCYWWLMPPGVRYGLTHGRGLLNLPRAMVAAWLGGWFLLLFGRAEDLHIQNPFPYQRLCRFAAMYLIAIALVIAVFLAVVGMDWP